MKPRILHVIDHTGSGGAQVVVRYLIEALAEDFDFSVAVLGKTGRFSKDYRALGVPVFELGNSSGRWSPLPLWRLLAIIRQGHYELVHTHLFKSNVLGTISATWSGCKAIIHDHSDTYAQALEERLYFSSGLSRSLYLSGYRYALIRCHRVIVLTPKTLRAYEQVYSLKPEAISFLPNAVDLWQFDPVDGTRVTKSLREELGLAPHARLVMMIGRLEPQKDWWTFLQVACRVQETFDPVCAFIAVGSGSQEAELRDRAQQFCPGQVFLLGYRKDVPRLLRQADVFLLTSRREPFGIVLLEAMAAGCPVVTTRSGGPETIITHEVDGLLADVGDAKGLASHVIHILQNDALRQRLVQRGKETVLDRYSVGHVSVSMAAVYRQVLGK